MTERKLQWPSARSLCTRYLKATETTDALIGVAQHALRGLLNRVHFDWHMPSPQRDGLAFADNKIRPDRLATEQLSRDDEMLGGLLAILAQPSRDIHGVAEKGELPLGAAALANNHGPAMERGSELRHDGERAL